MRIDIEIPDTAKILADGVTVPLAPAGTSWRVDVLGPQGALKGVYVLHDGTNVQYVGMTIGQTMSFGVRLRREFQESASQNRHIYPKLRALSRPIKAVLLSEDEVDSLVTTDLALTSLQKIALLEIVLIQAYRPRLQDSAPDLGQIEGQQP